MERPDSPDGFAETGSFAETDSLGRWRMGLHCCSTMDWESNRPYRQNRRCCYRSTVMSLAAEYHSFELHRLLGLERWM